VSQPNTADPTCDAPSKVCSYRDRVYEHYVSAFKGRPARESLRTLFQHRGRIYDSLLGPLIRTGQAGHVLEVACGQGTFLHWAERQGIAGAHGCDIAAEQIAVAQELGLAAELASYHDYLPRFTGQCDLVVGLDIIEHLSRDEAFDFLDLCHQALRPGGHLFLTTPNGTGFRAGNVLYGDLTHETIFCPQSITVAMTLAGFENVSVREIPPPLTSVRSSVRRVLWNCVRLWPMLVDMVETGSVSSHVLTRVMAVQAEKPTLPLNRDSAK